MLRIERAGERLNFHGEFDLAAVDVVRCTLAVLDSQPAVLDLGGVTFLDSTGLRTLLSAKRDHAGLRIENPSAAVARLLEVTGTRELVLGS